MTRESFIFYKSFYQTIDALPIEMQRNLYRAIAVYGLTEEEVELDSVEKAIWFSFKAQLDANWKRYNNGLRGGAPIGSRNNPNGRRGKEKTNQELTENKPKNNQELTENKPNVNDNVNDNVNIISISPNVDIDCPTSEKSNDEKETKVGEEIRKFYNEEWQKSNSDMPKINGVLIGERYKLLTARIRQYGIDAVKQVIISALRSDFLNGRKTEFRANFEWIMRPKNFPKVLDGHYEDNRGTNSNVGRNLQDNDTSKYKNQRGWK